MNILPGDLLFVWGHGLIQEEIEIVKHGPSDFAMFVNPHTVCEAQGGRLVGESDLSFYLDGRTRLEVWEDQTLTNPERQQMVAYARTLYGTPYDLVLIPLEFLHYECRLPLNWYHENKHRICSSLMYAIGDHVGRKWADCQNCAPVGLMDFGVLQKKMDLTVSGSAAS